MKIELWLAEATQKLKNAGIGSAQLDCLILLEDCLHQDRSWLLAHPEHELSTEILNKLSKRLSRRAKHEPLAYIRGFTEFYGRNFKINKHVLEPRVESEVMIDLIKTLHLKKPVIADIGTGSGAIGITAKLELAEAEVDLYDIDSGCLGVARHNAHMHELNLHCYKRDLLNQPVRNYDVILANLPYVPDHWRINEAAAMEPRIAIFGGKDGLDLYRRLFDQAQKLATPPRYIFTECLPPQQEKLIKLAADHDYSLLRNQDFIVLFGRS